MTDPWTNEYLKARARKQRTLRALTRRRAESEEAWREGIRRAHAEGMSLRAIAAEVQVAHTRVLEIVRDK